MQRRILISIGLSALVLATGGSSMWLLIAARTDPPSSESTVLPLLVETLRLRRQTMVDILVGYGTAHADRYAWVAAQVAGEVVEVADELHVGSAADAGALLLRIDDRQYQKSFDRARALVDASDANLSQIEIEQQNLEKLIVIAATERDIADREYKRVLGLFERAQANRRELDLARQSFEQTRRVLQDLENSVALLPTRRARLLATRTQFQAEADLAALDIERCRVIAPFSGRIEQVMTDVGERVAPGVRLLALLDPDRIEVPIELPVSLRARVREGAACRLILESDEQTVWSGAVARIAPQASVDTRTFSLFLEIDNTRQTTRLMPGFFVRATIEGALLEDVIVVPRGVIQDGRAFVFDAGVSRSRAVEIVRHLHDRSIVTGMQDGERLITTNLDVLYDGAPVRLQTVDQPLHQTAGNSESSDSTAASTP